MSRIRDCFEKAQAERNQFKLDLREAKYTEKFLNNMVKDYSRFLHRSRFDNPDIAEKRNTYIGMQEDAISHRSELTAKKSDYSPFRTMTKAFGYFIDSIREERDAVRRAKLATKEAIAERLRQERDAIKAEKSATKDFVAAMRAGTDKKSDISERINDIATKVVDKANDLTEPERQAMSNVTEQVNSMAAEARSFVDRFNEFAKANGLRTLKFEYKLSYADGPMDGAQISNVQNIEKPVEKSIERQVEKPVDKLVEKPVEKQVEKPVDKPIERPIEKPIEKSVEKPIERQVEKPVDKPIEKPIEKPVDKPAEKPVERTIEKPVAKPATARAINENELNDLIKATWSDRGADSSNRGEIGLGEMNNTISAVESSSPVLDDKPSKPVSNEVPTEINRSDIYGSSAAKDDDIDMSDFSGGASYDDEDEVYVDDDGNIDFV